MKFTTGLLLELSFSMSGIVLVVCLYAFVVWTGTNFHPFYSFSRKKNSVQNSYSHYKLASGTVSRLVKASGCTWRKRNLFDQISIVKFLLSWGRLMSKISVHSNSKRAFYSILLWGLTIKVDY